VVTRSPNTTATAASRNSDAVDRHLQRNVVKVRRLGDRALFEMMLELAAVTGHRATVESVVARYAGIDQVHLYVTRGDRFAPQPTLRVVGGRHGSR
jgi:hypothetical protein